MKFYDNLALKSKTTLLFGNVCSKYRSVRNNLSIKKKKTKRKTKTNRIERNNKIIIRKSKVTLLKSLMGTK